MADESPAWGPDDGEGSRSKEEKEPVMVRYASLTQKGRETLKAVDETLGKISSVETSSKTGTKASNQSDLPSVTLLKDYTNNTYYDYVGRVEVRPSKFGCSYIVIADRKTGKQLCEIDSDFTGEFLKYDGKVIRFRGKLNKYHGIVEPHNK